MRLLRPFALGFLLLSLGSPSLAVDVRDDPGAEIPFIRTVQPATAKVGDVVVASGTALARTHMAELYLTDGEKDYKVEILSQSTHEIKFKVPEKTPAARLSLMVLTVKTGMLIEQPTYLTIR
jgi:hypothetical protein